MLLPIATRELRVAASRANLRWVRVGAVAFAALFCLQGFAVSGGAVLAAAGYAAFRTLAWVALLLALAAVFVTADSINWERREGTLGLLFLTDLRGYDVVLGKLVVAGLNVSYIMVGFAPVLMLPLLAGGVTPGEVARSALALVNVLFVALAAGLLVSVRGRTRFAAMRDGGMLILGLILLPWLPGQLFGALRLIGLEAISPAAAFSFARESSYPSAWARYWVSLVLGQIVGWGFLQCAARSLVRNWGDVFAPPRKRITPGRRPRRTLQPPPLKPESAAVSAPVVPRYSFRAFAPVAYAVLRLRGQGSLAWGGAFIAFVGSLLSSVLAPMGFVSVLYVSVSSVFSLGASGLFAWLGGRFLFEAKRSGELELLLSTPVGASGVIRDQWLALVRLLRGPLVLIGFAAVPNAVRCLSLSAGSELTGLVAAVAGMANAVLSVLAACWVGMWFGQKVGRPLAVAAWTVGLVEIAPTLGLGFLVSGMVGPIGGFAAILMIMPLALLAKNLAFIAWARSKLRQEFRTSLTHRRRSGITAETEPVTTAFAPNPSQEV